MKNRIINVLKKIGFALVAAVLFFSLFTGVVEIIERNSWATFERMDDRITYRPVRLLKNAKENGREVYLINDGYMIQSTIPKKKGANVFRIVLTGGSFAMGTPYTIAADGPAGGMADWIEAELEWLFPEVDVEMINAAAGGQNSRRVMAIVEKITRVNPDLIIVATGNNESELPPPPINDTLHQWTFYRMLKKVILPTVPMEGRPEFPQSDHPQEIVDQAYRENILRIVAHCKKTGTPLLLATLPVNLKYLNLFPDSRFTVMDDLERPAYIKAVALAKQGLFDQAAKGFAQVKPPFLAHRKVAQCEEKMGQFQFALDHYKAAVEALNQGRMRPSYNDFIRKLCREKGVALLDMEAVPASRSPHGISDPRWFFDNCHMHWAGYYTMGQEAVRVILDRGLFPKKKKDDQMRPSFGQIISKNGWEALYSMPNFNDLDLMLPENRGTFDNLLYGDVTGAIAKDCIAENSAEKNPQ